MDGLSESGTPLILGDQLRRARLTVQLTYEQVAEKLGIRKQEVTDWEAGHARPTLRQLEALGELYGREVDYFLRQTAGPPVQFQFRSATEKSFRELAPEALLVIARFDELCREAFELEHLLGKIRPIRIAPVSKGRHPSVLAREIRRSHGFGERPITKLRDHLGQRGVRIFELVVPLNQFSGFSYWHAEYGPCILVNAGELPGRRNFTLAHEFGHLLYHHRAFVCDIREEGEGSLLNDERTANLFGIEFLLPAEPVKEDVSRRGLSKRPSVKEVGTIAGRWGVSVQAMAYRLEDLGVVGRDWANAILASYRPERRYFKPSKTPTWERRLGADFVSNTLQAYSEGHISLGKVSHYLGLPLRKAFEVGERYKKSR